MTPRARKSANEKSHAQSAHARAPQGRGPVRDATTGGGPVPARLGGVAACFFLSGFAALIYETAWLRQLSLVFGTSEFAVAAVLGAYMAGLAAGAAVAARFSSRVRRPMLAYGLLEAGIAVSALAVPLLLAGADGAYAWLLGARPEPPDAATIGQPVFYLVVGFLVLALPTACMGATLPLLTRYAVRADREVGPRVALLYALNTAGAVLGTVAAAFVFLPALGLRATVWVGVAVNLAVFAIAVALARGAADLTAVSDSDATRAGSALRERLRFVLAPQPAWILPLMLVSGAVAFCYEVLWTRMLTHVLGGSLYAFATMLAAFLAGIALGGGLAGTLASSRERAAFAFAVAQATIALLSIAVYAWMGPLIPATRSPIELAVYAALVMLPATVFIGATFPFAVRVLAPSETYAATATARVYAWNTLGAILGAILGGYLLIPELGFEGAIKLAVLVNLALALWAAAFVAPRRAALIASLAAGLAASAVLYTPARPRAVISSSVFALAEPADKSELYYAVGRSATVWLTERGGKFELRTNGLPEASVLRKGAPPIGQTDKWLAALPLASRPSAATMLVIGFGGGVALEGIPPSVRAIDVVELEPEVIEANRRISDLRAVDPLADPRVKVVLNDARNALRLTEKRYDLIVSQPSHPWTAGASHLFTREFLELAKGRLNEGGVLLQWMSTSFVDAALLRSLAATLAETFVNVRLYQAAGSVLYFLASDAPLDVERQIARTGEPIRANVLYFGYMGLSGVDDFVAALALDEVGIREFAAGAPPSTDDRNRIATDSHALANGLSPTELMALLAPRDPLLNPRSFVHGELRPELDFPYIATRLLAQGQVERATALSAVVPDPSQQALIRALTAQRNGQGGAAREELRAALRADPDNDAARFALLRPQLTELARGSASAETLELARPLTGSAAAVVRGWGLALAQDFRAVAALDDALAGSVVMDFWFPEAARLRADWRIRVAGEPRYARDALRIIDRALLIRQEPELVMLRAEAAAALDDADALLESARYAAQLIADELLAIGQGTYAMPAAEVNLMHGRITAWQAILTGSGIDAGRVRPVAGELERLRQTVAEHMIGLPR
jgi:spermidine synthase